MGEHGGQGLEYMWPAGPVLARITAPRGSEGTFTVPFPRAGGHRWKGGSPPYLPASEGFPPAPLEIFYF